MLVLYRRAGTRTAGGRTRSLSSLADSPGDGGVQPAISGHFCTIILYHAFQKFIQN
eukprot:COSAG02_NODE_29204_length_574_cov_0.762105_1_plen_55_part_01